MPPKRRATSTRPQRTKKARPVRYGGSTPPPQPKRQRKDPEPDPSDDSSAPDSETETPAPSYDSDLQAILAKLENLQSEVSTLKSKSDPENERTFLDHTILAGKFVEFSDLLPQSNLCQQQEEEYVMKSFGKNKMATYTRNQNKQNLPYFLWLEACDIFTSIYVERATSRDAMLETLKSLLTYKKKSHTREDCNMTGKTITDTSD